MTKQSRLVTIAQFDNNFDAELAKQTLENEEIQCILFGQEISMNIPYLPSPVLLQVFEEDAARAKEILQEKHTIEGEQ